MSRAKILALSLVAAITLGSGTLAQGGGGGGGGAGGGGAGGGASGAGAAAGASGAGSGAGASGAHGAVSPGTGNPNSPVSIQPPGTTGQNTINSPGTGGGPGPNPGPPNK